MNQECTGVNLFLVFINFLSLELRLLLSDSLSLFLLALFRSFLVFIFLSVLFFFQSLSFSLLFFKFPLLCFFSLGLFSPLDVFDHFLLIFIFFDFGNMLILKLLEFVPYCVDLLFELGCFFKKLGIIGVLKFDVNLFNFFFKILDIVFNWQNFVFNICYLVSLPVFDIFQIFNSIFVRLYRIGSCIWDSRFFSLFRYLNFSLLNFVQLVGVLNFLGFCHASYWHLLLNPFFFSDKLTVRHILKFNIF